MKIKTSQFKKDRPTSDRDFNSDIAQMISRKEGTKSKSDMLTIGDKLGLFYQAAPQLEGNETDRMKFYNFYLTQYAKRNKTRRAIFEGLPTGGGNDF